MKKVLLTLAVALVATGVMAQSTEAERANGTITKKGLVILPQAGDVAISVSADPFLKYGGNMFNTSANAAPTFGYTSSIFKAPAISAKYFLTDNTAVRVKLHIGYKTDKYTSLVRDDAAWKADNTSDAKVEDVFSNKKSGLGLSVGYEMRRGYGRLQGFYGAEIGLGISSSKSSTEYGNGMVVADGGATSTPWTINSSGNVTSGTPVKTNNRILSTKNGSTFGMMLGGFAGVEYFVAPKISLAGEVGLGLLYQSIGEGETETEKLNSAGTAYENKTVKNRTASAKSKDNKFGVDYTSEISVAFHF